MTTHSAEYMRRYRKQRPDYYKRSLAQTNARIRAANRLADLYPNLFRRLYEEELAADGLEPPRKYERLR